MPAIEPFHHFVGINSRFLTRTEKMLLEADLFDFFCRELIEFFKLKESQNIDDFYLNKEGATIMLEVELVKSMLTDILLTEEYTLSGIAYYTNTPEDVIYDICIGQNTAPSAQFLRKIIALHRSVKAHIYSNITKKIAEQYSSSYGLEG